MDKQKKIFQTKTEDINAEERTIVFTLSDDSIDRDNEIMRPKGAHWGEGKQTPPFLWAHRHDILPIGKFQWLKRVNNEIKGKVQFAPTDFAMSTFLLYQGDYINSVSIGFLPDKDGWEDNVEVDGKTVNRVYNKFEIIEVSGVPVGSNRNALQRDYADGKLKIAEAVYKSFEFEEEKTEEEELTADQKFYEEAKESGFEKHKSETDMEMLIRLEPKLKELDLIWTKRIPDEKAEEEFEDITKPYPNEHSCRLEDPKQFDKFRRKKCEIKHDEKCIDVIYGVKENKSKIQAMRYNIDIWKEAGAKAHCKTKKGTFEAAKPEGKEIDLENLKVGIGEIDIDKMEVPETGLENLVKDVDITEEQYQKLLTGIQKVLSDGLNREFRETILGEIVD